MINKSLLIISFCISLIACKKNSVTTQSTAPPIAGFSVLADTLNNVITVATYDQDYLINNSSNADTYFWNFGNDSTSTEKTPHLNYTKSGTYHLTLTVKNTNGQASSISKTVKVLDRVIKQVTISSGYSMSPLSQSFTNSTVWAVIKLDSTNKSYPLPTDASTTSFNAPIIYKTPDITTFDSLQVPYTFTISNKMILNYSKVTQPFNAILNGSGVNNIGYGVELYGKNSNGTFIISSSYLSFIEAQSGYGMRVIKNDIQNNIFIIGYLNVWITCDFE